MKCCCPSTTSSYLFTEKLLKIEVLGILFAFISQLLYQFYTSNSDCIQFLGHIIVFIISIVNYAIIAQLINFVLLINHRFRCLNSFLTKENTSNLQSNKLIKPNLQQMIGVDYFKIFTDKTLSIDMCDEHYNGHFLSFINNNEDLKHTQTYSYKRNGSARIHSLRMLYDVLCDIVTFVNDIYGFQMLIMMVGGIAGITTTLNSGIVVYIKKGISHEFLMYFIWAVKSLASLFLLSGSCNSTIKERSRTSVLLQKLLLLRDIHPETKAEINLFLQQVSIRSVKFTALDFFTIKYSILGSMLGAVTTYLVMMVQFQKLV
ncbi:hypothetical protein L9F63_024349 [Diploptera punctata]|uniref:Gustatory receptor n=1 Tax=Diploptera punctata TaxID=6984 RepID=A0AAD7ZH97_DIPPU|nr:hypothetical protein L9F63_024349 [Diploptera punctata]